MSLEAEIGPVHYTLHVPALDQAGYTKLQTAVMMPVLYPRRRPLLNIIIVLVVSAVVGSMIGYLASKWSLSGQMWIGSLETGEGWALSGSEIFLAAAGLVLFAFILALMLVRLNHRRMLRRLHDASSRLLAPLTLSFGEGGILSRSEGKASINPWPRVTGLREMPGYLFILIDHATAFWLPESTLANLPDRDGFMRFLKDRIGQPAPVVPQGGVPQGGAPQG
ncbi:YcxB family protein [Roseomonas aerophila]|uniref:YcxB family protein n=1 Tax=Teichococcus aerophilus TaxID=1224513 RepID=A0ABR7RMK1_9PROT|nr:YcxB family protein [Pseudoroseomonas aerophila]MBC9207782.1 YcxB family protein [Pseudoroseomonas aerophila]